MAASRHWIVRAGELWAVDQDFDTRADAEAWLDHALSNETPETWIAMKGGRWIRLASIDRFDIFETNGSKKPAHPPDNPSLRSP